jgi:hypothetical protein
MTMTQTEMGIGKKRVLSVALMCAMLLVTVVPVSWGTEEGDEIKSGEVIRSKCDFTKYLVSPENRTRYENTVAKARAGNVVESNYDNAAMYGVIAKASFGNENGGNLDSFSAGCLSCHDGKSASDVMPKFKNNPGKKGMMMMISGKHPIGMDYHKYTEVNNNLKRLDEMSQNLTLVEGRVSCITCHDPLNSDRFSLRITTSGIDICSACHVM